MLLSLDFNTQHMLSLPWKTCFFQWVAKPHATLKLHAFCWFLWVRSGANVVVVVVVVDVVVDSYGLLSNTIQHNIIVCCWFIWARYTKSFLVVDSNVLLSETFTSNRKSTFPVSMCASNAKIITKPQKEHGFPYSICQNLAKPCSTLFGFHHNLIVAITCFFNLAPGHLGALWTHRTLRV